MDFSLDREQEEFQQAIRRFVADAAPMSGLRDMVITDLGYDAALWTRMSRELGVAGLLVPEVYGGAEATVVEAVVAMEELGRAVVPCPLFSTVALGVVPILAGASDEQKAALLPAIADGTRTATTAMKDGPPGDHAIDVMRAKADGDAVTLTGTKVQVVNGHSADTLLVLALPPGGFDEPTWYLVAGDAAGLRRERVDTFDLARPMATLTFDAVSAIPLGGGGEPEVDSGRVLNVAKVLLAAEMVGGTHGALDMSLAYARLRHQFGRPIGSFQAIKHRCAEAATELDSARALTLYAAHLATQSSVDLATVAPMALATAASAFDFMASWNIQIHGGIGFTWEHDAHLFYRRAKADRVLLGSVGDQWLEVADRIGI
ncbi:acyl-CoA dehydrogenase family protein [Mycolicibacterium septicum]|uniref:Acyl-CoA dehydrogenase family protein n=1 Tax=Mycolicibacterium septicum TaxID=98668 RepID=A0ABW9M1Q0_9MYCO